MLADDAPLWAVIGGGVLGLAPELVRGALWLVVRATGSDATLPSMRPLSFLAHASTMAAIFVAALITRDWIVVALLASPGLIFLVLLVQETKQAIHVRRCRG